MERTKVVLAQAESKSLRTTIPAGIARQFGIKEGSELGWDIRARDSQLEIVVAPVSPEAAPETKAVSSSRPSAPIRADKGKARNG
jgi:bifunctional DNA-binding transcriptional regulator/antitoxin component of YhaV-PrlF toxin-antitoxin module